MNRKNINRDTLYFAKLNHVIIHPSDLSLFVETERVIIDKYSLCFFYYY